MGTISFARGVPAPECLPSRSSPTARAPRSSATAQPSSPTGRAAATGRCASGSRERHGVEPARVLITNGSLQGFVFLARAARQARRARVRRGADVRPAAQDPRAGLGAEIVPAADGRRRPRCPTRSSRRSRTATPAFLYTIPTFQNPSGRTLSAERRRRLVELAREHDLLVLEDDPYGLVRYEGEPLPTLFELDGGDGVVYASSFSKTVAPGVRVGYFVLPLELAKRSRRSPTSTYISPPFLTQATVHEFLRRGNFEPNLERVNGLLKARRDAMLEALERHMPDGAHVEPAGGRLLPLARLARTDAPAARAARERGGRDVRQGHRLLRRRQRRRVAAARVQLRLAGRDRRRRRAARRRY